MAAAGDAVEAAIVGGNALTWVIAMTARASAWLGAGLAEPAEQDAAAAVERAGSRACGIWRSCRALGIRGEAALARGDRQRALDFAREASAIHSETGHAVAEELANAVIGRATTPP